MRRGTEVVVQLLSADSVPSYQLARISIFTLDIIDIQQQKPDTFLRARHSLCIPIIAKRGECTDTGGKFDITIPPNLHPTEKAGGRTFENQVLVTYYIIRISHASGVLRKIESFIKETPHPRYALPYHQRGRPFNAGNSIPNSRHVSSFQRDRLNLVERKWLTQRSAAKVAPSTAKRFLVSMKPFGVITYENVYLWEYLCAWLEAVQRGCILTQLKGEDGYISMKLGVIQLPLVF